MATYESPRYRELGFYVEEGFHRFSGGLFHTDDPAEIAVLDTITDVVRIDEEVPEEPVIQRLNRERLRIPPQNNGRWAYGFGRRRNSVYQRELH